MMEGDRAVYTIDKDAIDNMVEVDPFSVLNKFVTIPNIEMVDKIDINIDGTAYTMDLKRITDKNEKGEEEVKTTYFFNGKEAKEDLFKDVYQKIISARYDAPIKEEINAADIAPFLTLTFHLNDNENTVLTASYLPYDDSFYIINNGETRFFADKRKIDDIIKAVKEFKTEGK
jgi:hypothetical protein